MIPVNEPIVGLKEMEYVEECLKTGWISSAGRFIGEFERAWADYCDVEHAIAVSNGTVALQLALRAIDLRQGDEVILPTFTIISCATAVVYNGGVPILVDCDPETWCMDVNQIERQITKRTKAILPVHIYGHPVDMDPIEALAKEYDLAIIEDAAEAHGAEYLTGHDGPSQEWRRAGSLGNISTFSFYANKLITTGEGGMVLTDHQESADQVRSLANMSYRAERRFFHTELGFNFRMTNLQAAVGLGQTERIEEIVERKRQIGKSYNERLADIHGLNLPVEKPWARNVYWMYGVVLDESHELDAVGFAQRLADKGVQTRPFFLGMHRQPALWDLGFAKEGNFPVADSLAERGLYLPSGLAITDEQIDEVCASVADVLS